jgi:hypothetical protein
MRAELWTGTTRAEELANLEHSLVTGSVLDDVFKKYGHAFVSIGLLSEGDVADLQREFLHSEQGVSAAVSFPTSGIILVSPEHAQSVGVLSHELGHIVTAQRRYTERIQGHANSRSISGDSLTELDIDAIVALWLAEEADAEMTSRVAVAYAGGGDQAVRELWKQEVQGQRPDLVGPATVTLPGGKRVQLAAGEEFFFERSILKDLTALAYGASLRLVQARHQSGEELEDTLQRMWSTFSFTTREVLTPEAPLPSPKLRALADQQVSQDAHCTRVGALLVREMLEHGAGLSRSQASQLSGLWEDDVLVRSATGGVLWVIRWSNGDAALAFNKAYSVIGRASAVEARGIYSVLSANADAELTLVATRLTSP